MAIFERRGKRWRARVRKLGIDVSESFARKGEAVAWALETESAIEEQRYGKTTTASFAIAAERYSSEVSPSKRGARWEQLRLRVLSGTALFAEKNITAITPDDLGQWRDERLKQVSTGTVLREMTLLSAVFEHARREWRLIQTNPMRDVRKPPQQRHRERIPTDDEIERICLALGFEEDARPTTQSQQVAVAFLLAIESAMRAGEILSLVWAQIDTDRRVARLEKTKNGDVRAVPLSSKAVGLLEQLRGIDPAHCFTLHPGTRDALFRRARDAAGIKGLTFHDSRALALTRLAKRLDVLELARMVGHRDPRSLMIYFRESVEELAKKLA